MGRNSLVAAMERLRGIAPAKVADDENEVR